MLEQFYPIKQQVAQVTVEDAVVVIKVVWHIHAESGLNIDSLICIVYHKVNLFLNLAVACAVADHTDINGVPAPQKFVVDDVFHDMTRIVLAVIQSCIPKPDIHIVVLVRILEIGLSFDVISLCH